MFDLQMKCGILLPGEEEAVGRGCRMLQTIRSLVKGYNMESLTLISSIILETYTTPCYLTRAKEKFLVL